MISSETPYKLAEIIRATWPGLYKFSEKKISIDKEDKEQNCYENSSNWCQ
jgi:hypothetical protein